MRNAADHVDAHIEGADEIGLGIGRTEQPVLREGDELQIDIGLDPFAHLQQRLRRKQPVVADVDMAADEQQPLRNREVAIAQRPLDHRLMGEQRLELAPERDALQQRASG